MGPLFQSLSLVHDSLKIRKWLHVIGKPNNRDLPLRLYLGFVPRLHSTNLACVLCAYSAVFSLVFGVQSYPSSLRGVTKVPCKGWMGRFLYFAGWEDRQAKGKGICTSRVHRSASTPGANHASKCKNSCQKEVMEATKTARQAFSRSSVCTQICTFPSPRYNVYVLSWDSRAEGPIEFLSRSKIAVLTDTALLYTNTVVTLFNQSSWQRYSFIYFLTILCTAMARRELREVYIQVPTYTHFGNA